MKNTVRKLMTVLLALIFVVSGGVFLHLLHGQRVADRAYQEAADIAWDARTAEADDAPQPVELPDPPLPLEDVPEEVPREPLPEEARLLLDLDLPALQAVNGDVLGWIYIPDTSISYPLLRSGDNSEYLKLTWDLRSSAAGSIFLERRNSADLSDFNTLIYGHNMKNGTMFSDLRHYRDQAYFDSHPHVYIVLGDAVLCYRLFAAYTADVTSDTYRLIFEDDARKQSAIDFYLSQSSVECDLAPAVEDRILTLSTCTGTGDYDYRLVVQGVLAGEFLLS